MGTDDELPELPELNDALRALDSKSDDTAPRRPSPQGDFAPLQDNEVICRILERKEGSGIVTRQGRKVGCEYHSIREKPRFLATVVHYSVCELIEGRKGCPYSTLPSYAETPN